MREMRRLKARFRLWRSRLKVTHRIDRDLTPAAIFATVQRIFWTAPVMGVGNLLVALGFARSSESSVAIEALWRELIIKTNFLVSLISFGIWVVAWRVKKRPAGSRSQFIFVPFVVVYVLAVGMGIALVDHLVMTSLSPLLICVAVVGTFYYLPPTYVAMVFILSLLIFRWAFQSLIDLPPHILDSTLVNGFMVHVLGVALSTVNWRHFRSSKLQEKTIANQQVALTQMAYQDSLTGLSNRRFLDELVEREVAMVRRGRAQSCLIMCDIDDFKTVNDTFGHTIGDRVLQDFAHLLQGIIRNNRTIVRLGGEEFVILAPETSLEEAVAFAEQLRRAVEEHEFVVDHNILQITASFGVASLDGNEQEQDYYYQADKALYDAKLAGKNRVSMAKEHAG